MPNIPSAAKRARQAIKNNIVNRAVKAAIRSAKNDYAAAVTKGDKAESDKLFKAVCSLVDKAVKRGVIKANNASRNKARAAKKLNALK